MNAYESASVKVREQALRDPVFARALQVAPVPALRAAHWLSTEERGALLCNPADRLRALSRAWPPSAHMPSKPCDCTLGHGMRARTIGPTTAGHVYIDSGVTGAPIAVTGPSQFVDPQPVALTYGLYAGYAAVQPRTELGFSVVTGQMIVPSISSITTDNADVFWWVGMSGPTYSQTDGYILQAGFDMQFDSQNGAYMSPFMEYFCCKGRGVPPSQTSPNRATWCW